MTPAQELRLAAAKVRRIAEKATKPPWVNHDEGDRIIRALPDGTDVLELMDSHSSRLEYVVDEPLIENPHNGAHIALWDPAVALLVADLLAKIAHDMDENPGIPSYGWDESFALARAINRKES